MLKPPAKKPPETHEMLRARWETKILRDALYRRKINIPTSLALDIVALMHMRESWRKWADEEKGQPYPINLRPDSMTRNKARRRLLADPDEDDFLI